jgi:hypothetical protein
VSKARPTNIAASVRARLLTIARRNNEELEQLLTRYCAERFLYRLGASAYSGRFLLKGAMLFAAWEGQVRRPTRDLDLLGFGELTAPDLASIIRVVCAVACPKDGVTFLPETIRVDAIREDQEYGGQRAVVEARIGNARLRCQVDVGLGDAVTPGPIEQEFPSLLPDLPRPRLRMYPRETGVAEKLEAMVQLGITNSRMKDFFDLWHLSRSFAFDGGLLVAAVRATFARRATALPADSPVALTDDILRDHRKRGQWAAFLRAAKFTEPIWEDMIGGLRPFLLPLLDAARRETSPGQWAPAGPWTRAHAPEEAKS